MKEYVFAQDNLNAKLRDAYGEDLVSFRAAIEANRIAEWKAKQEKEAAIRAQEAAEEKARQDKEAAIRAQKAAEEKARLEEEERIHKARLEEEERILEAVAIERAGMEIADAWSREREGRRSAR